MILAVQLVLIGFAYFSGAIPYGYILTKHFTGQNVLKLGSGNSGSTNVARVAGKKIAVYVQLLDMLKGLLPVLILLVIEEYKFLPFPDYFVYLLAISSILGHNFSVFLKFKGGKGVNTTLGASVLLAPIEVFTSVAVYFLVKWRFKYVSLGSITLAICLPLMAFILKGICLLTYYLLFCCLMILIQHIQNIKRLLNGKENI